MFLAAEARPLSAITQILPRAESVPSRASGCATQVVNTEP